MLQFGGLGALFREVKPPKAPPWRRDWTQCMLNLLEFAKPWFI